MSDSDDVVELGSSPTEPIDLSESDYEIEVEEKPAESRKRKQPAPTRNLQGTLESKVRVSQKRLKRSVCQLDILLPRVISAIIIDYVADSAMAKVFY